LEIVAADQLALIAELIELTMESFNLALLRADVDGNGGGEYDASWRRIRDRNRRGDHHESAVVGFGKDSPGSDARTAARRSLAARLVKRGRGYGVIRGELRQPFPRSLRDAGNRGFYFRPRCEQFGRGVGRGARLPLERNGERCEVHQLMLGRTGKPALQRGAQHVVGEEDMKKTGIRLSSRAATNSLVRMREPGR